MAENGPFNNLLVFLAEIGYWVAIGVLVAYGLLVILYPSASVNFLETQFPSPFVLMVLLAIICLPLLFLILLRLRVRAQHSEKESVQLSYSRLMSIYVTVQIVLSVLFNPPDSAVFFSSHTILADITAAQLSFGESYVAALFIPLFALYLFQRHFSGPRFSIYKGTARPLFLIYFTLFQLFIYITVSFGSPYFLYGVLSFVPIALIVNVSYLNVGLARSIGMTVVFQGVTLLASLQFSSDTALVYASYIPLTFLIFWSMTGFFTFFERIFTHGETQHQDLGSNAQTPPVQKKTRLMSMENLWIRSSCPSCGNASFKVLQGMNLECMNCKKQLGRDSEGPFNVRVEIRRTLGDRPN